MSSTGGRKNIFGVLFQILAAVEWAVKIAVQFTTGGDDEEVRIISEPEITSEPAEGGDIEIRWPYSRVVQQMKTRTTGEPWRLREVIAKAFPDLYLSVDSRSPGTVRYELVLDSPQGDWSEFETFQRHFASNPVPARPAEALDDDVKVPFFPKESLTYREMFIHIRDTVRKREEVRDEPFEETERDVWHLLANFYVVITPSGAAQREVLRPLIQRYGYSGAEVDEKIDALVGAVLRRSTGEVASFSPSEILAEAGISGLPVSDVTRVRHAARFILDRDLRRRTTYSAAADIRQTGGKPIEGRIGALVAESGGGKTWELARRAVRAGSTEFVAFRVASVDPGGDVRSAIETIARDVLGWKVNRTTDDLIAALRSCFGTLPDPWLTIFLDNVGIAEVDGLLAQPLSEWGVRVIFSTSGVYADALGERAIETSDVPNFSTAEVTAFLARHDCDPDQVPREIRDTLRLPLLAWIYATVARRDHAFRPTNEYLLYDRYWRRLRTAGVQAKYPGDEERLVVLARSFRDGGGYPWPTPTLDAAGVGDEVRHRLESIGWLTRDERGNARIWHDRLLNWAVAESSARDMRHERLSIEEVSALLARMAHVPWTRAERPLLGYVPMDVLWMLSNRGWATAETLSQLIEALEAPEAIGHDVYKLLPSVGTAIAPAIVLRAMRADAHVAWLFPSIVRALITIYEREDIGEAIDTFLRADSLPQQVIGFMLAGRRPAGRHLPRLWDLRLEIGERFHSMSFPADDAAAELDWRAHLTAVERVFDALRHCVRAAPEWLEENAPELATQDAGATAGLIAAIADSRGLAVWQQTKKALKEHAGPDDVRKLIECIRIFRDAEERTLLDDALRSDNTTTQAAAFGALIHLDPDAAVALLSSLSAQELAKAKTWWLPWLDMLRPEELAGRLVERVKTAPADGPFIGEVFLGFEVLLPPTIGHALLDWLAARLETVDRRTLFVLSNVLDVLADAPDPAVRESIRACAGSPLEARLLTVCSADGDDYQLQDVYRASTVLRRIEGEGFRDFVYRILTPEASYARAEFARYSPEEKLSETLKARIDHMQRTPDTAAQMLQSTRLLAQAGGRLPIVEMVWKYGSRAIEIDVPYLVDADAPLADAQLAPFLAALQDQDEKVRERAVTALGLSGRRDQREIVISTARAAAPASALRHAALLALENFTIKSDEIPADLIAPELWKRGGWNVARMLFRSGTDASLALLEQFLDAGPQENLRIDDERAELLGADERGRRIAKRIWSNHSRWPADWWHGAWLRIAKFLDDHEARDWFREHAFQPGPNAPAIAWQLRHYDSSSAWRAAVSNFESGHLGAVEVMMRLNEARAIGHLAGAIPGVRASALRAEIGRQFRIGTMRERVQDAVAALVGADEVKSRVAGYELAGWVEWTADDATIKTGAINGGTFAIVQAAADAYVRRRRWATGRQTLISLREVSGLRAWNDCEILVRTVDAFVLDEDRDELCIWSALTGKPLPMRRWVAGALEDAKKKLLKDAEERDRSREWL